MDCFSEQRRGNDGRRGSRVNFEDASGGARVDISYSVAGSYHKTMLPVPKTINRPEICGHPRRPGRFVEGIRKRDSLDLAKASSKRDGLRRTGRKVGELRGNYGLGWNPVGLVLSNTLLPTPKPETAGSILRDGAHVVSSESILFSIEAPGYRIMTGRAGVRSEPESALVILQDREDCTAHYAIVLPL